jgi:hypothetical protein
MLLVHQFFCTPQQVLTFISIFGVISGIIFGAYHYYDKRLTKKRRILVCSIPLLICLFFLLTIRYAMLNLLIYFLVATTICNILIKYDIKHNKIITALVFSILISYLISGLTGNACFYSENFHNTEELYVLDEKIGFGNIVDFFGDRIPNDISCDIYGFRIKQKFSDDTIRILLYDDPYIEHSFKEIIMKQNEEFVMCCHSWKFINITNDVFVFKDYDKTDTFCFIQNFFSVKGFYR